MDVYPCFFRNFRGETDLFFYAFIIGINHTQVLMFPITYDWRGSTVICFLQASDLRLQTHISYKDHLLTDAI